MTAVLWFAGVVLVPLALALVLPRRVRTPVLAATGALLLAWAIVRAQHQSLVENGGDWGGGWPSWLLAVILNCLYFVPLWTIGSLLGVWLRSRIRTGRARSI